VSRPLSPPPSLWYCLPIPDSSLFAMCLLMQPHIFFVLVLVEECNRYCCLMILHNLSCKSTCHFLMYYHILPIHHQFPHLLYSLTFCMCMRKFKFKSLWYSKIMPCTGKHTMQYSKITFNKNERIIYYGSEVRYIYMRWIKRFTLHIVVIPTAI
jgi:hypothetical protein